MRHANASRPRSKSQGRREKADKVDGDAPPPTELAAKEEVSADMEEMAMLQNHVKMLDKQVQAIQGLDGAEARVATMKSERLEVCRRITALKPPSTQVSVLKQAIETKLSKHAKIEAKLAELAAQQDALEEDLQATQQDIESCQADLQKAEQRAKEMESSDMEFVNVGGVGGLNSHARQQLEKLIVQACYGSSEMAQHVIDNLRSIKGPDPQNPGSLIVQTPQGQQLRNTANPKQFALSPNTGLQTPPSRRMASTQDSNGGSLLSRDSPSTPPSADMRRSFAALAEVPPLLPRPRTGSRTPVRETPGSTAALREALLGTEPPQPRAAAGTTAPLPFRKKLRARSEAPSRSTRFDPYASDQK